ncbi:MAG TPA: ketopantoate reductase family protein, partial [Candidatus Hydrogenedentes bacterium]|nr:ketopantoate reductase family protein [Candidatus Hydrogenedentota bacterium]HPO30783.1 ketopantoate reductase family protein [Candidatus Hydrogenedentota bacterium]
MRAVIIGAGALGSSIGGFMARAGHEVVLVGRDPHMRAIREQGLRITGIWGGHHVREHLTALTEEEVDRLTGMPWDAVFITVKSFDTPAALNLAAKIIAPETVIINAQNGLGNVERSAGYFGRERVLGARVIFGSRVNEPGLVEITVIAAPTAVGAPWPESPSALARQWAETMDAAGLPTVYTDCLQQLLWAKTAYNAALNPLSALLDVPYGRLPEIPDARVIMDAVIDEVYLAARVRGITLDPPDPEAYRDLFYERLVPPTAAHYASMHADLRRGRPTEIEAINGAVTRFAEATGHVAPVNRLLTRVIHAREVSLGITPRYT